MLKHMNGGEPLDVDRFYAAVYPRLVGQVALLTGSRAEAEEIVQDAVVRLLPRWSRVSTYDDPEGWLRRVAFRLAVSRWRRARVAAAGLLLMRHRTDEPPPDGAAVDLARALAKLPLGQRQVLLLHHVVGLPVQDVALELGIAIGTVKSRLSRGRAALSADLRDDLEVAP